MSNEFVPRSEAQGLLRKLRSQGENRMCFDCKAKNPTWASISHGIYICFECAGLHRSLGTHLSFVRSTTLDNWKRSELSRMELGGNQAFREWMESQGAATLSPSERYKSRAAELYREQLDEKVRGHVPSIPSAGGSAPAATTTTPAAAATTTTAATPAAAPAPARQVTVLGSKKAEVANAPKGRLGVTKIDTDSFFDDFDAPEPEPAAPAIAPAAAAAAVQAQDAAPSFGRQPPPAQSSRYAYTDASLMGSAKKGGDNAEVYDPDAVFGMSKPKTPYSFGVPPDFDADASAKQQQQQQPRSYTTKASAYSSASASSSAYGGGGDSDYAQRKFANAKSISSDQFFDDGKKEAYDPEKEARLSKFNGARAISSADYFDRDESQMKTNGGGGYFNPDDISAMGAAVMDKTRELASTAQQWISSFTQNI